MIDKVVSAIVKEGGQPLYVGGYVRDQVMGIDSKDIDIEVFGLDPQTLIEVLSGFGKVDEVGVSFGVIKLFMGGEQYDFTLPRTESRIGVKHTDFHVDVGHSLTPRQAASRRDFTINAIARNKHGQLVDPFNGLKDIKDGVLRAVGPKFAEDPLRVLRGVQFAGRFNMIMDNETANLCRSLLPEAGSISKERVREEFVKWAVKSVFPSKGLEVLIKTGWIKMFPELYNLCGLQQDPEWHPEGDVFRHTAHTCDAMARIFIDENDEDKLVLMLAALCHDLGKAETTEVIEGRIRAPQHATAGVPLTQSLLERMGFEQAIIDKVKPLVAEHMAHINEQNMRSVRRLALRLHPVSIHHLAMVIRADMAGRPPKNSSLPQSVKDMILISEELDIQFDQPKPIIMGRHLIELGMKPGPEFKPILDECFEAQIEGEFDDIEGGLEFLREIT